LLLPVILLIADNARAFYVSTEVKSLTKSLGFGFSRTLKTLRSSFPFMAIMMVMQMIWLLFVYFFIAGWRPQTSGGILLLLLTSQLLILTRLFLKTWRYAGVTVMMEKDVPETIQL